MVAPSGVITRMLSVLGHIALKQLVHLDCSIFGEMKRRNAAQEAEKMGKQQGRNKEGGKNRTLNNTSATARRKSLKVCCICYIILLFRVPLIFFTA